MWRARVVGVLAVTAILLVALPSVAVGAIVLQETASELAFDGLWHAWSNDSLSGGGYRYANSSGSAFSSAFTGTGFSVVGRMGPEFGIASLTIDSEPSVELDFYSAESTSQHVVYARSDLTPGDHIVRIEWSGRRNAGSTGTYIDIDAFHVEGSAAWQPAIRREEHDALFSYAGSWRTWSSPLLSGGSYAYTGTAGSSASMSFTGTALDLIVRRGPEFGIMVISVDGGPPAEIDLYSPTTEYDQRITVAGGLAPGRHEVRVECTGRKSAGATGTYIGVDGALVQEMVVPPPVGAATVEESDARWSFSGGWGRWSDPRLSGGTYRFGGSEGASVAFSFEGTRLDVLSRTGPEFGQAVVTVDGYPAGKAEFYTPETQFGRTVFSTLDLPPGPHVVCLSWAGTRTSGATASWIGVDAVSVVGTLLGSPVEETDYRIVRVGDWGSWRNPALSGGAYAFSGEVGAHTVIEFDGDYFGWTSRVGPEFGVASVSIDDGAPVEVDLYAPETRFRQQVFSSDPLVSGPHRVVIACTGKKNPAASGGYIGFDSLLVNGVLRQAIVRHEQRDPRIGSGSGWSLWSNVSLSGGDYAYTNTPGSIANIWFVGTSLDYLARTGPEFGHLSVRLDGGSQVGVDLYSPETRFQQCVYSTGELPYGLHKLQVGWTGVRNPASSGTNINLDAVDVAGSLVSAPKPAQATFNYPWARYLVVDKSDFRIYLVENGNVVVWFPIAHGKVSSPTPNAVWRMGAKYYPDPLSVYGPRKMRLFRQSGSTFVFTAYNIHGTNNPASIGTQASAGCIRLYNQDILVLFDMVPIGTMVVTRE